MSSSETIGSYLARLAAGRPTPGGGATGALQAAQGAALLGMAARFTTGEGYEDRAERMERIAARADEIVQAALQVSDDDQAAFGAVADAYALPAGSDEEQAERSEAIQRALRGAVVPPRELARIAAEVIGLCSDVVDAVNPNVLSDVAAAAEAARAAAATALVTLEINLRSVEDEDVREGLRSDIHDAETAVETAAGVTRRVRDALGG
ncbi:cyclodeaminase/cyclohydrolase family protein [Zhihengliuella sp.]|uniref:cyclodeaminase/cyclohydrolase family protein n=1 Tax=Zhihengliuella sp. TaxID=1954483 RepID=UPI0028128896|nr:cyclodeaminase/cyclohydrolase family protein [Zhihengliuella sp.]